VTILTNAKKIVVAERIGTLIHIIGTKNEATFIAGANGHLHLVGEVINFKALLKTR